MDVVIVRNGAMEGGSENMVKGVKMFGPALIPYWRSKLEMDGGSEYANGSSYASNPPAMGSK